MPSATESNMNRIIIFKTTLLMVAITVNAMEMFLPRIPFLPWLKPGLANCVTIVWIIRYGGIEAVFFTLLRIWLVCFYFGLSFITLSLSLTGGMFATCMMGIVWKFLGQRGLIGTIGLAIIGATAHNFGQLITVFFLLTYNVYIFYQVPFMVIASIIFGTLVGILAPILSRLAGRNFESMMNREIQLPESHSISLFYLLISILLLMLSISLVIINKLLILLGLAVLVTCCVQIILHGSMQALLFPIRRFWILFLFVACLLMFLPYGKKIEWAPLFTYEGTQATIKQWLRLWTWLQISFLFTYFKFHAVIFRALNFFFKDQKTTLYAGLLAMKDFPGVFDLIRKRIAIEFKSMLRHPILTSKNVFQKTFHDVADFIISHHQEDLKEYRL